jgi:hypothetical protein
MQDVSRLKFGACTIETSKSFYPTIHTVTTATVHDWLSLYSGVHHKQTVMIIRTASAILLLVVFLGKHIAQAFVPVKAAGIVPNKHGRLLYRDDSRSEAAMFADEPPGGEDESLERMSPTIPWQAQYSPMRVVRSMLQAFDTYSTSRSIQSAENSSTSRSVQRAENSEESCKNTRLFALFAQLRNGIPAQAVHVDSKIQFVKASRNLDNTFFYQTKDANLLSDFLITYLYYALEAAPTMVDMDGEPNYDQLYGDKILPHGMMMLSESPEDCFLRQTGAFCKAETAPGANDKRVVCDLSYLESSSYELKREALGTPGYGGKAIVENGEIVEILHGVGKGTVSRVGDEDFSRRKSAFLSSFAVHVIVVHHAIITHLAVAQRLSNKLTVGRTDAYIESWNENKGASLLLRALTYRTNAVSMNEQLLIGPGNSLVGRACSFTNKGLLQLGTDMYQKYKKMNPEELIDDLASQGSSKWNLACKTAWDGAKQVVNTICKDMKEMAEEDLSDLALILWVSTFYHGFIGDFQLDNVNKGNLLLTLTKSTAKNDLAYGTLATTIGVTTMTRTLNLFTAQVYFPKLEDRQAWAQYVTVLKNIDAGVEGFTLDHPVYTGVNF